jgi:predicted Rossmann-fold nucleotide-binding protein
MLGAKYSQEDIDQYVYKLLKAVVESPDLKNRIESVVTGGQSGVDEAGAKAASRLGLKTTVLAPKGWRYRDEKGEEVRNEKKFKERFSYTTTKKLLIEATPEAKVAKQTERFAVGAAEVLDLDKFLLA